jgi:hypothetical protein
VIVSTCTSERAVAGGSGIAVVVVVAMADVVVVGGT